MWQKEGKFLFLENAARKRIAFHQQTRASSVLTIIE